MIKIKKLSAQNFKGLKSNTLFHFDSSGSDVSVLSGPNGFGKTTIFDVIEFCLTGDFKRVDRFDQVQKKTNNKNKPFFQNTDGEDVILKLWLYDTATSSDYVIIKHYNDATSPAKMQFARNFIPADSKNIFSTYLTSNIEYFESDDFSNLSIVALENINAIFHGQDFATKLSSTYYLFNYIQQEDSIYFLRQNEDDKGSSLGFLFNIEKEEAEKHKLLRVKNHLLGQRKLLDGERKILREALPENQRTTYVTLFEEIEIDFDKENPFDNIQTAKEQLTSFQDAIASLITFKNNFSIAEFDKYAKYRKLNQDILANPTMMRAIVVKDIFHVDLVINAIQINLKINKANEFLNLQDSDFISKEYFDLFLPEEEEYRKYLEIETTIKAINSDLGQIGTIIADLNAYRIRVFDEFLKIKDNDIANDKNCPLCDTEFYSFTQLEESFLSKTHSLESYNQSKLQAKQDFDEQLRESSSKITTAVRTFLDSNRITDELTLALFRELPLLLNKIDELTILYPILNNNDLKDIYFSVPPNTIAELDERQFILKSYLEENLLSDLAYNEQLIENRHLYSQYFNLSKEKLTKLSVDDLGNKLQYLLGSYSMMANSRITFFDQRINKLDFLLEKVNRVYDKLNKTIQDHKAEMIKKIKVPFYVYSGKILQSYQQGLGIFIEIHPTDQSNNVRFKTGHSSDHDIVYHLSSGQMAVVSLAFCLSLNKVYNTTRNFKFLAIDDPVQTMDDLNIHTFVELIRNEFQDFQIVFSTHDDFTARYMKYKFDKFNMPTEIQDIQRLVLEQQLN